MKKMEPNKLAKLPNKLVIVGKQLPILIPLQHSNFPSRLACTHTQNVLYISLRAVNSDCSKYTHVLTAIDSLGNKT